MTAGPWRRDSFVRVLAEAVVRGKALAMSAGMGQGRGLGMGRGGRGSGSALNAGPTLMAVCCTTALDSLPGGVSPTQSWTGAYPSAGRSAHRTLLNVQSAQVALDAEGLAFLDRVRQSCSLRDTCHRPSAIAGPVDELAAHRARCASLLMRPGPSPLVTCRRGSPARGGDELGEVGQAS